MKFGCDISVKWIRLLCGGGGPPEGFSNPFLCARIKPRTQCIRERSTLKKRLNGEGNLRKRADGRYEATVMIGYRDDGRKKTISFYGRSKEEAREKLRQALEALAADTLPMPDYTFSEWADIWFEHHKGNITATTQQSYGYTLVKLKEYFGEYLLDDIMPFDIEAFLTQLREEGFSDSYLTKCRALLYQIFHKAEANDLITKNPVRFAEKMRSTEPRGRKDAFTAEEVKLLIENLPHDRIGESIKLLLGTGMRMQELLGLEKKHIAEDGSYVIIEQAVQLVRGTVVVGRPKSRDSYRTVPVPTGLWGSARYLRDNAPGKYIWEVGVKDQPCNPSHFRHQFKKALSAIEGVRVLTPHSCRHTYVSQMQALHVDIQTIQSMVGHADTDMTQHYLHVQSPIQQEAVRKFSDAFCADETE